MLVIDGDFLLIINIKLYYIQLGTKNCLYFNLYKLSKHFTFTYPDIPFEYNTVPNEKQNKNKITCFFLYRYKDVGHSNRRNI